MEESIKLDYSLNAKERKQLVETIIQQTPPKQLTSKYLEILSDYMVSAMSKKEKQEKTILTDNRLLTINKRETSYQGLAEKFENGEEGVWNILKQTPDKNVLLTPKIGITEKDLERLPELKDVAAGIEAVKAAEANAEGIDKLRLKKWLIELYREQYVIKSATQITTNPTANIKKDLSRTRLVDDIYFDEKNMPHNKGSVDLFDYRQVAILLDNYADLYKECGGDMDSDCRTLLEDFKNSINSALEDKPLYKDLVWMKIGGDENSKIQEALSEKYKVNHTVEYISSLWKNKIPKIIADAETRRYLLWYYTYIEKGKWKRCSRCGEIKLAHNLWFSKNCSAKDGWYSMCKECRNKKEVKK